MNNFWLKLNKLKKPIYALAPMAGITDSAFRQMCKKFGADVVYSEMASATALFYQPEKTIEMLRSNKEEAPYVIQLFGSKPEHFAKAVKLLTDMGKQSNRPAGGWTALVSQGIDINFGCPVKKVVKQGAGAVLMDKPKLAREIIKAVMDNTDLPVSIKTRTKAGKTDILRFLDYVNDLDIAAVMIHGRTMTQGFSGSVDTEMIKKARNYFGGVILANGGVVDYDSAIKLLHETGADGLGIARGALGRPWIFSEVKSRKLKVESYKDIFRIALRHAKLVEELKGKPGIIEMRKHLCWYVAGLPGARKMRTELVKVKTIGDVVRLLI